MPKSVTVQPQFPAGASCRVAFVGEAPGADEIAWDPPTPLVGPSGRIFNAILRTAGIDRSACGVTNVFSDKLPDNEVGHWCEPASGLSLDHPGLPWGPIGKAGVLQAEHLWHLERLQQELAEMAPTVIVALGGTALWALCGTAEIAKCRGAIMEATRLVPGTKVVPAFHPAFVQKQWKYYVVSVADYRKAWEEGAFPEIRHKKRRIYLEPSLPELGQYADERLFTADRLGCDIETGWGQITCVSFAPSSHEGVCVPFVDLRSPDKSYWKSVEEEVGAWKVVRDLLASPIPITGQNFTYDTFWFLEKMGLVVNNYVGDTRLLHHAIYPELPKDLAFLGSSYEQVGAWKTWRQTRTDKRDD